MLAPPCTNFPGVIQGPDPQGGLALFLCLDGTRTGFAIRRFTR